MTTSTGWSIPTRDSSCVTTARRCSWATPRRSTSPTATATTNSCSTIFAGHARAGSSSIRWASERDAGSALVGFPPRRLAKGHEVLQGVRQNLRTRVGKVRLAGVTHRRAQVAANAVQYARHAALVGHLDL